MTEVKHHTSFQPLDVKRYVPVCSCGFRGAVVASAVAALAAANAHARAQGAEPWPPESSRVSLTDRQRVALAHLADRPDGSMAFNIAQRFLDERLTEPHRSTTGKWVRDYHNVAGAANTLVALKRRGLVQMAREMPVGILALQGARRAVAFASRDRTQDPRPARAPGA